MASLKIGLLLFAAFALSAMPGFAADLETQVVDKNCWIEVFDDDDFDMKDDHYKIQGPKEFASLTDVGGKNWNNDIESVIVGREAGPSRAQRRIQRRQQLAAARAALTHPAVRGSGRN